MFHPFHPWANFFTADLANYFPYHNHKSSGNPYVGTILKQASHLLTRLVCLNNLFLTFVLLAN
jgi:hypothetical protein